MFTSDIGNTYTVFSPRGYGSKIMWIDMRRSYITFRVRACEDVGITLAPRIWAPRSEGNNYKVSFGIYGNFK